MLIERQGNCGPTPTVNAVPPVRVLVPGVIAGGGTWDHPANLETSILSSLLSPHRCVIFEHPVRQTSKGTEAFKFI